MYVLYFQAPEITGILKNTGLVNTYTMKNLYGFMYNFMKKKFKKLLPLQKK